MGWDPFKRSRKNATKYNEFGESARQQAFVLFSNGFRPAQIFKDKLIPVKKLTLFRYFEDWKKVKHVPPYSVIRRLRKTHPELSDDTIKMLAEELKIPEDAVVVQWSKPWGLKQLLNGEWPRKNHDEVQGQIQHRLAACLDIIRFAELFKNSPEQVAELLAQITMLTDNTRLEVTKDNGETTIKIYRKGNLKIVTLPAKGNQKSTDDMPLVSDPPLVQFMKKSLKPKQSNS